MACDVADDEWVGYLLPKLGPRFRFPTPFNIRAWRLAAAAAVVVAAAAAATTVFRETTVRLVLGATRKADAVTRRDISRTTGTTTTKLLLGDAVIRLARTIQREAESSGGPSTTPFSSYFLD
jgi:glycine/serine hydroxymethyltransferase